MGRPKRATRPRFADANRRIGGVNRWNARGQGGVEVDKGALQRPRATGFRQRGRGGLMTSVFAVRRRRILLNDAPIAVEKKAAIVTEKMMKLSARNQLKGKVVEVHKGA